MGRILYMISDSKDNYLIPIQIDLTVLRHYHETPFAHYNLLKKRNKNEPKSIRNFKAIDTSVLLNCSSAKEADEIRNKLKARIKEYNIDESLKRRTEYHLLYFASLIDEELELVYIRNERHIDLKDTVDQIYNIKEKEENHLKLNGITIKDNRIIDKALSLILNELNRRYTLLSREQIDKKGSLIYPISLIGKDGNLLQPKPVLNLKFLNESRYLKVLGHWAILLSNYFNSEGIFIVDPNINLKHVNSNKINLSNKQGDLIYDFFDALGYLTSRKKINFYKHNIIRKYIRNYQNEYLVK